MKVSITSDEEKAIEKFVRKIIEVKKSEEIYINDCNSLFKRWKTGMLGEYVIEKKLDLSFRDQHIGNSRDYSYPDMKIAGYKVGIKSSRFPYLPVINRNIKEPQIFVLFNHDYSKALILGLADMSLLKENLAMEENDNFIIDKNMLDRKTCFSLIDKLKPINSISDLEIYKAA